VQICIKYCTKAFGDRAPQGSAGELTTLPSPPTARLRGRDQGEERAGKGDGGKGGGRKVREEAGEERRTVSPPFGFSGYAHAV